jgi:hypothetical protein
MPRDGLQQYAPPPGTQGVANYTIESARYNTFVADITTDQNNPRPIVAGGTGASDAITAMTNLGGEIANQQVTNYDTFPFKPGSFWSLGGATSAPDVGSRWVGTCTVINDGTGDMRLDANQGSGGLAYYRVKSGGVWGAWVQKPVSVAGLDAAYVNVTGDTMSGPLNVTPKGSIFGGPSGTLSTGVVTQADANILMYNGGGANWCGFGTDTNGDFWLRTGISGTPIPALRVANNQAVSMSGTITAGVGGSAGIYYFGNSGTKTLNYDGIQFNLSGGSLFTSNNITAGGSVWSVLSSTTGTYYFGNTGTKYLNYDGTNFSLVGGILNVTSSALVGSGGAGAQVSNITLNGGAGTNGGAFMGWQKNGVNKWYDGLKSGIVNGTSDNLIWYAVAGGKIALELITDGTALFGGLPDYGGATCVVKAAYGGGGSQYGMTLKPTVDNTIAIAFFNAATTAVGTIGVSATSTAYNTSSSAELKEDLKTFDAGNIIDNTEVYDFRWRSTQERSYGVIAQQAVEVYPTAVTHTINPENKDDEFWGVDYSKYVPVLLQELKALRTRVAELEGRLLTKPA